MVCRKPPVLTLTVAGRRSGRPRRVPVIPIEVEGRRHLVAPYGESEWVRNVRACGEGTLDGPHGRVRFEAR